MVNTYMDLFARFKVGMETHNISGCEGDCSQRGNWQAFGAQAALNATVEGPRGHPMGLGRLPLRPLRHG